MIHVGCPCALACSSLLLASFVRRLLYARSGRDGYSFFLSTCLPHHAVIAVSAFVGTAKLASCDSPGFLATHVQPVHCASSGMDEDIQNRTNILSTAVFPELGETSPVKFGPVPCRSRCDIVPT